MLKDTSAKRALVIGKFMLYDNVEFWNISILFSVHAV